MGNGVGGVFMNIRASGGVFMNIRASGDFD